MTHVSRMLCGVGMICVIAGATHADIVTTTLDDFSAQNNGWPVITSVDTIAVYESDVPGVLGGYRGHKVTHVVTATGADSVSASIDTTLGKLDYSSTAGASGWVDLTYGGDFAFLMHGILFSEPVSAGSTVTINFDSLSGVSATNALVIYPSFYDAQNFVMLNPLPLQVKATGAQAVTYTFPANSGMQNLQAANFYMAAPTGASYVLDSIVYSTDIAPTPEPASFGFLLAVPLLLRGRRR
ncbi:MAG TPA: hypothetical protein VM008_06170 [Phycisphaerae bacterium]|nr:hypothetical protein [Phycisphaerae bacterium]